MRDVSVEELKEALASSWSRETCYPPQRDDWSKELPSLGQCAVTSLLLNDLMGGKIFFNPEYNHYWIETEDGISIDLTIDQFGENVEIYSKSESSRESILEGKRAEIAETKARYKLLKEKFEALFLVEQIEESTG